MQRFRSTWLALMGGALLIVLSVSAAFGANPSGTAEGTRGQTIAAFVHDLVFGSDELADDETEQDDDDSDESDEDTDEESDDSDEETDEDVDRRFVARPIAE